MLGVVLAGGESRRMGRDKALVEVDGEPLWKRQLGVLLGAGASRAVLIRRGGQEPIAYPDCHLDRVPDSGPLAGLHAAMEIGGHPLVAVLAVDMPGIDAAWFIWLRSLCRPGVGAVAGSAGALEPLAAIYPAGALPEVAGRLARRELSVQGLARALAAAGRMTVAEVPAGYAGSLASLNEPPA